MDDYPELYQVSPPADPALLEADTGTSWADVAQSYVDGAWSAWSEGFGIVDTVQLAIDRGADSFDNFTDNAAETGQHLSDNAGRFALGFTAAQLALVAIGGVVAVGVFAPELLGTSKILKALK